MKTTKLVFAIASVAFAMVSCNRPVANNEKDDTDIEKRYRLIENEGYSRYPELSIDSIDSIQKTLSVKDSTRNTIAILTKTLKQMKCKPEIEKKDWGTRIWFTYQGESFLAEVERGSVDVTLVDLQWYDIQADDPRAYKAMMRNINNTNVGFNFTVFVQYDEDKNQYDLLTKRNIIFLNEMPQKGELLSSILKNMVSLHDIFVQSYLEDYNEFLRGKDKK